MGIVGDVRKKILKYKIAAQLGDFKYEEMSPYMVNVLRYELDKRGLEKDSNVYQSWGPDANVELYHLDVSHKAWIEGDPIIDSILKEAIDSGRGEELYKALKEGPKEKLGILKKFGLLPKIQTAFRNFLMEYKRKVDVYNQYLKESGRPPLEIDHSCAHCGASISDSAFIEEGRCNYCGYALNTKEKEREEQMQKELEAESAHLQSALKIGDYAGAKKSGKKKSEGEKVAAVVAVGMILVTWLALYANQLPKSPSVIGNFIVSPASLVFSIVTVAIFFSYILFKYAK
jgi:DNA-directed RNA polymerase subunit RPC12/RpoP